MKALPMSAAASGLLRALLARAGVARDRIFLISLDSREWHSLTFVGERHAIALRIPAPEAEVIAERIVQGLEDAEFVIPRQIVADIAVRERSGGDDGSVTLTIEALTVAE
jgi:hypothetical protein